MVKLCDTSSCTGCMACLQTCPIGAISTKFIDGFSYPVIDSNLCVSCGKCNKVCPVINSDNRCGNRHLNDKSCFAAWNKDDIDRLKSSSGGVFSAFAKDILSAGGVVFGAAWDSDMSLVHVCVSEERDLDKIRRSKYVQSDTSHVFYQVKSALESGRQVLFCGTPCQVAGLTLYLSAKKYDNLITVDVLCQGVPSPIAFKKYIHEIEIKKSVKVYGCNFRSKKRGWRTCRYMLVLDAVKTTGKRVSFTKYLSANSYYNSYYHELFMRPSCYQCQFKQITQGYFSDITIADFWRIGNVIPFNCKSYTNGVSAVLVNTDLGAKFFEQCSSKLVFEDRTWEEFATNGGLYVSKKPSVNDDASAYLNNHSWAETQDKFWPISFKQKIRISVFLLFGEKFVRRLKQIIIG